MIYRSHSGLILDLEHSKQQRTWLDCKAVERKALLWDSDRVINLYMDLLLSVQEPLWIFN